jgi:glycosyltransferase involved in cell wall biosynthesis
VRESFAGAIFDVYGEGEEAFTFWGVNWKGAIGWNKRGEAFRGASVIVVPSRAEPFGMVILEAMEHRVPVIYPADSGAAEVLQSGVKVKADDTGLVAKEIIRLLSELGNWELMVRTQADEISTYPERGYEELLIGTWRESSAQPLAQQPQRQVQPSAASKT